MSEKRAAAQRAAQEQVVVERTYRARADELWALWTTREGFESWWGPEGFRVEVHTLEARPGGALHYDMIADSPEAIAGLRALGRPPSHETRGRFSEFRPFRRLALTHRIDFLPGVAVYEATISVDFLPAGDRVRMVVTLDGMHDGELTRMQEQGFRSQLGKLDRRFGAGPA